MLLATNDFIDNLRKEADGGGRAKVSTCQEEISGQPGTVERPSIITGSERECESRKRAVFTGKILGSLAKLVKWD